MTSASVGFSPSAFARRVWADLDLKYRLHKLRENVTMEIAWRLPHNVVYWAVIRAVVENFKDYPADVKVADVLKAWGHPK